MKEGRKMSQISNLERFLNFTTPTVRSQILPKVVSIKELNTGWQPSERDRIEFFNLGDLWDCYDEWSAYGVETPFVNCGETVTQHFTPYLSAIQIYTDKNTLPRYFSDDTDGDFESKSWSSESEDEKLSRSSSNSDRTFDIYDLEVGFSACCPVKKQLGELYFEYFEHDVPFRRVPLKDKINALACEYPLLKSLNSVDLSPASWMAVAWYTLKLAVPNISYSSKQKFKGIICLLLDLSYSVVVISRLDSDTVLGGVELDQETSPYPLVSVSHTSLLTGEFFADNILTEMDDNSAHAESIKKGSNCEYESNNVSLYPYGLAAYRMQPRAWLNPDPCIHQKICSLKSAAGSWLKQLGVQHPDFNFFTSHDFGDRI